MAHHPFMHFMNLPPDVITVLTRKGRMSPEALAHLQAQDVEVWNSEHIRVTHEGLKRMRPEAQYHGMREMYGSQQGKTIYICGSGPTLLQAPAKLPGLTLSINKAITRVESDFFCFGDLVAWKLYKDHENAKKAKWATGAGMHLYFPNDPIYLIEAEGKPSRYSREEMRPLYWNCATFSWVLHWAVKMQPKRIVLLGCEFSLDNHFDGTNAWQRVGEQSVMTFSSARVRMDEMFGPDKAEWFDPSVEILDTAPNGYLPVPKVKLEDVL